MFFIHSSHVKSLARKGSYISPCPMCRQEQPHSLYDMTQRDAIYGLKIKDTVVDRLSLCEICGAATWVGKKTCISVGPPWAITTPIEELAKATGYTLVDPQLAPVNKNTVEALLRRIANTPNSRDIVVPPIGYAIALLAAAACGALCWWLGENSIALFSQDPVNQTFVGIAGGGLVGLIVPTGWKLKQHNKGKRKDELLSFMKKLALTLEHIKTCAAEMRPHDYKVAILVEHVCRN